MSKRKLPVVIPTEEDDEEEDQNQTSGQTGYWASDLSESAFNCPKGEWPTYNKNGSVKLCVENAIAALRWFLDDRGIELKYDRWRKYQIMSPATIDDPTIDWLNEISKEHKLYFSLD